MPVTRKGRYYPERLPKGKRQQMTQFFKAMYTKEIDEMPRAKKSQSVEVRENPAETVAPVTYVDADGIEQTIDILKVKNLGDTAYAESQKLFPNAEQCFIGKSGELYDDEGRENMLNENLVIVSARHMTMGDYGPWFLLQCIHPEKGEITIPAPGEIANAAIEAMSGIALTDITEGEHKGTKAGFKFGPSELPTWARFEFVPEKGAYGNGYFVILPAVQQAEATPVEAD